MSLELPIICCQQKILGNVQLTQQKSTGTAAISKARIRHDALSLIPDGHDGRARMRFEHLLGRREHRIGRRYNDNPIDRSSMDRVGT